ncbi:histamine N-methyltransferase-like isoform X1 [Ptychodera flava]|uniref:histamine N-methyltransferase-like isoform X1 n=1 Tax=Ptychodera flava TaxID=63121 RepID=UPI00396A62BA
MTQDLKALVLFPKEYFERYEVISRYGYDEYFLSQHDKNLKDTFESFVFCGKADSTLRVLAVGTSDGTSDIQIIDTLNSKYSSILYVVVEPAESQVQKFQTLVQSKQEAGLWKNVKFDFHSITVEEYLGKTKIGKEPARFDIIHLQHCAYHFADIEGTTVELYGRLNTGGMLFILLVTGAWEQMLLRMGNIVPESMSSKLGSATMRKMLQRRIPDVKMQTQYRKISFKFDEGFKENSEDGNMMLDFVLQVLDFRKTAPPEIVGDFMKFFKELCYEENGELYFPADDEIITVIKQ